MSYSWFKINIFDKTSPSVNIDTIYFKTPSYYVNLILNAYTNNDYTTDILYPENTFQLYYTASTSHTNSNYFTGPSTVGFNAAGIVLTGTNLGSELGYTYIALSYGSGPVGQSSPPRSKVTGYNSQAIILYDPFPYTNLSNYDYTVDGPVEDPTICYNEGTLILCDGDQYKRIEDLKKGDLVKTYLHGYKAITHIGSNILNNNPNNHKKCMYILKKTETNELIDDLITTGLHSILVDELTQENKESFKYHKVNIEKIDDKYLLPAFVNQDFSPINEEKQFRYYHLVLENDGDKFKRYGIYANGILSETTFENNFCRYL